MVQTFKALQLEEHSKWTLRKKTSNSQVFINTRKAKTDTKKESQSVNQKVETEELTDGEGNKMRL